MRRSMCIAIACIAAAACRTAVICTLEAVAGVSVSVADESGEPVSAATLTLVDGDYSETLMEVSPGEYIGAFERAGVYMLTVEADGFDSVVLEDIVVQPGECHVVPAAREVTLGVSSSG